jgi:PAS domain S-box-containing protein
MNIDSFADRAPAWIRFSVAVLIVLFAFSARFLALPLTSGLQFLTFYPAIVLSFYICGGGPGIFSILLSTAVAIYAFFPPYFSFEINRDSVASVIIFLLCAMVIGAAMMRMHSYRRSMVRIESDLMTRARQQTDEGLQLLVDGARLGVWRWSLPDDSLIWSDRCYRHFGISPDSGMSYRKFISLLHPDDQGRIDEAVTESMARHSDYEVVYRAIWPDGSEHWIYALGRPYYSSAGVIERMDGVLLDITELKSAQIELQRSEERFRAFVLAGTNAVYRMSPDWRVMERLEGRNFISDTESPSRNWLHDYILPGDQPMVMAAIGAAIDSKEIFELEHRVIRKDGGVGWTHSRAVPVLDEAGRIIEWFGSAADVTERRNAEEKARENADMLSAAFESISDLLMIVDKEGRILKLNDTFLKLCDYERAEDVPEFVRDLEESIHVETLEGETVPIDQWPISRGIAGHRSDGVELRVQRKDNPAEWLGSFNVSPIYDGRGAIHGAILLARDISKLKQQEVELRRSLKQFAELAEAMPQIVWTTDRLGNNTYFNSKWVEYTGLTLEESYGHGWNKPFHPDDRRRAWEAWRHAVDQTSVYSVECRLRRADGAYRWWLVRGVPAFDEAGKVYKWFGTCTDIEEIKLSEAALRAALQYSRSLLEASLDPLVTISAEGKITDVNQATATVTGLDRDALIGSDFSDYFTEPDKARAGYQEIYEKGFVVDYPLAIRHRTGRVTDVLYNASVFHNDKGEVAGVFAAARDVTKLKRTEAELHLHRQHLEDLVALRTQDLALANQSLKSASDEMEAFAYSVSHDLRVPLRAIDGFSLILLEDYAEKLDDEGNRILKVIRDSTVKISQLIDDILAFSRAVRVDMHSTTIDMNVLVKSVLTDLEPTLAGRMIRFDIEPLDSAEGDAAMLRRVWINLLDNAIKFTALRPEAVIEIGSTRGDGDIAYHVKDNGVGFDMQYASKLFGVFQRLHGAEFPGTGIGLAIVKRVVARHQGRVWAEGAVDEGATFHFTLLCKDRDHG